MEQQQAQQQQSAQQQQQPPSSILTSRIYPEQSDQHNFQLQFEHPLRYLVNKLALIPAPERYSFKEISKDVIPSHLNQLVLDLREENKRAEALKQLSSLKECSPYDKFMGPLLWYSAGTMSLLVEEIVSAYPFIDTPQPSGNTFQYAVDALTCLQTIALNAETCHPFVFSRIPFLTIPFLRSEQTTKEIVKLKERSMWLFTCIVQRLDYELTCLLLDNEILRYCRQLIREEPEEPLLPIAIALYYIVSVFDVANVSNKEAKFDQLKDIFIEIISDINRKTPSLNIGNESEDRRIRYFLKFFIKCLEKPKLAEHLRGKGLPVEFVCIEGRFNKFFQNPENHRRCSETFKTFSILNLRLTGTPHGVKKDDPALKNLMQ
ncbi:putative CCR4-NOT transcription complex subunit 9 [Blattamonas nauphoetae]|uniref:CCR4-NOT transcription complex subunit 9 n=1 Tax=Blattamonas nauphoetae TaxID=2049346 RepID=A0ABQ9Y9Z0_9EUKA|nr:putative CCR4-NOT transcription complex subunit 9 [Blattamonas nauphoetae]